jgi:hypothetical protein
MSRYDDTFQDLLYQLNESPAKPSTKCPEDHIWKLKDGKWECVKKPKDPQPNAWRHGGINEAEQQIPTVNPNPEYWDGFFETHFASDTIDKFPDRDTWGDKRMTINVNGVEYNTYDVDGGVLMPDPDDLATIHFFEGGTSEYLNRLLTGQ